MTIYSRDTAVIVNPEKCAISIEEKRYCLDMYECFIVAKQGKNTYKLTNSINWLHARALFDKLAAEIEAGTPFITIASGIVLDSKVQPRAQLEDLRKKQKQGGKGNGGR